MLAVSEVTGEVGLSISSERGEESSDDDECEREERALDQKKNELHRRMLEIDAISTLASLGLAQADASPTLATRDPRRPPLEVIDLVSIRRPLRSPRTPNKLSPRKTMPARSGCTRARGVHSREKKQTRRKARTRGPDRARLLSSPTKDDGIVYYNARAAETPPIERGAVDAVLEAMTDVLLMEAQLDIEDDINATPVADRKRPDWRLDAQPSSSARPARGEDRPPAHVLEFDIEIDEDDERDELEYIQFAPGPTEFPIESPEASSWSWAMCGCFAPLPDTGYYYASTTPPSEHQQAKVRFNVDESDDTDEEYSATAHQD